MTVELTEGLKEATGWSYRRLCRQTGVVRSSLIRWQERAQANKPLVRRPGPQKAPDLDRAVLVSRIKKLQHRRKLTLGSGKLFAEYCTKVSRREFQCAVANGRKEAIRNMRRVTWNVPGLAWTMDDTGRRGLPVNFMMSMNQMRDLCSRKGLSAKVNQKLLADSKVAEVLDEMIKKYGAPLFIKRDNGSNLNGQPVNDVIDTYGVIAVNSPPYYAQYNGFMEWSQRELKGEMANVLRGLDPDLALVRQAADFSLAECNQRPRPCLGGQTSDMVFEARHEAMKAYTLQRRREVYGEIMTLAMKIMARGKGDDRLTEQAAWRIAAEIWLRREGLITISVGGKVLPYYDPLLVS